MKAAAGVVVVVAVAAGTRLLLVMLLMIGEEEVLTTRLDQHQERATLHYHPPGQAAATVGAEDMAMGVVMPTTISTCGGSGCTTWATRSPGPSVRPKRTRRKGEGEGVQGCRSVAKLRRG